MISVKVHPRGVVGMCDEELLGKTFEEGKVHLDVGRQFYGGKCVTEKDVPRLLRESASLVGGRAAGIAVTEGVVKKKGAVVVRGVPHAQAYSPTP